MREEGEGVLKVGREMVGRKEREREWEVRREGWAVGQLDIKYHYLNSRDFKHLYFFL